MYILRMFIPPLSGVYGNEKGEILDCSCGYLCATCRCPHGDVCLHGQELASGAKVSIEQARAIALKAAPGKITDQELESLRAADFAIPST